MIELVGEAPYDAELAERAVRGGVLGLPPTEVPTGQRSAECQRHRRTDEMEESRMRLPDTAHTSRPWRIHEIAPDFELEDVWALPTPGGSGDLPRVVKSIFGSNFPQGAPLIVRFLWEARWKLGALFGWDDADDGLGTRVRSLSERLPAELLNAPCDPDIVTDPFSPLYQLEDEWAAELANRTVHTVMHLSWVPDEAGGYRGQMAVLVKPNGLPGKVYMAGIKPLRNYVVYPALLRRIEHQWHIQTAQQ